MKRTISRKVEFNSEDVYAALLLLMKQRDVPMPVPNSTHLSISGTVDSAVVEWTDEIVTE